MFWWKQIHAANILQKLPKRENATHLLTVEIPPYENFPRDHYFKRHSAKILTTDNFLKKDSTLLSGASLNRLRFPSAQWQEMSLEASLGPEL